MSSPIHLDEDTNPALICAALGAPAHSPGYGTHDANSNSHHGSG